MPRRNCRAFLDADTTKRRLRETDTPCLPLMPNVSQELKLFLVAFPRLRSAEAQTQDQAREEPRSAQTKSQSHR